MMVKKGKRERILLLMLLFVLLFTRYIVLINSLDVFYQAEPITAGRLARDIMDGFRLTGNILDYRNTDWLGGNFVNSVLLVPFLLILGNNFFVFSLYYMLWTVVIFATLYYFMLLNFGYLPALICCFLFIFPPTLFMLKNLGYYGVHFNTIFFNTMAMSLFFRLFFEKKNEVSSHKMFAFFGLISGFAVFFDYTFLITLFVCFIFWFALDRVFFLRKEFYRFLIFFVLGFSLWIIYNIHKGFIGFNLYGLPPGQLLSQGDLLNIIGTVYQSWINDLKVALQFNGNINTALGRCLSSRFNILVNKALLYHIFILSFLILVFKNLFCAIKNKVHFSPKEAFLLTFVVVYLLAYTLNPQRCPRYLVSLLAVVFIVVALFIDKLWYCLRTIKVKVIRLSIMTFFLIPIFFIGYYNYSYWITPFNLGNFNRNIFRYQGYSTRLTFPSSTQIEEEQMRKSFITKDFALTQKFLWACTGDKYQMNCDKTSYLYWGGSCGVGEQYVNTCINNEIASVRDLRNKYYQSHAYLFLGISLGKRFSHDLSFCRALIEARIEEDFKAACYEGLAIAFMDMPLGKIRKELNQLFQISSKYRHYFYIKLGEKIGDDSDLFNEFREKLGEEALDFLYQGMLSNLDVSYNEGKIFNQKSTPAKYLKYFYQRVASRWVLDTKRLLPLIQDMAKNDRTFFFQGLFGDFLVYTNFNDPSSPEYFFKPGAQDNIIKAVKDFIKGQRNNLGDEMFKEMESDIYKGIGCEISLRTFGFINAFDKFLNFIEIEGNPQHFYSGYIEGLFLRYAKDEVGIKRLCRENIPLKFREVCDITSSIRDNELKK